MLPPQAKLIVNLIYAASKVLLILLIAGIFINPGTYSYYKYYKRTDKYPADKAMWVSTGIAVGLIVAKLAASISGGILKTDKLASAGPGRQFSRKSSMNFMPQQKPDNVANINKMKSVAAEFVSDTADVEPAEEKPTPLPRDHE